MKSESFECILEFTYTGKVDFSNNDVEMLQNLVIACDYLGVTVLKDFCEEYLVTIVTQENVLGLLVCSYVYNMSSLYDVTQKLFMREFPVLNETDEYFELPLQLLQQFFQDNNLVIYRRDCIVPPTHKEREKLIFSGVLRYTNKHILSESVSSKELAKLLECVKLLEFDAEYLENELGNFPPSKENDDILEVFDLVKSYNSSHLSKAGNIPKFWMSSRKIFHRFVSSVSIAKYSSVGTIDHICFCKNEDELKPLSLLTKILLFIRVSNGSRCLGALEFTNSDGDVVSAGEKDERLVANFRKNLDSL